MTSFGRIAIGIAVSWIAAAIATPAAAATCGVNPQGVGFGAYDSLDPSALEGVGNVHVSCDSVVSFTVALSTGAGTYGERRLSDAAAQLGYNLYTDATRTVVWGDGISASDVSATGDIVDVVVYGRIPARQNVQAGAYVDTITVTVSY